jgi:hypothetical protein
MRAWNLDILINFLFNQSQSLLSWQYQEGGRGEEERDNSQHTQKKKEE